MVWLPIAFWSEISTVALIDSPSLASKSWFGFSTDGVKCQFRSPVAMSRYLGSS